MSMGGKGTKWHRKVAKNLIALVGCMNVTDRQTDDDIRGFAFMRYINPRLIDTDTDI